MNKNVSVGERIRQLRVNQLKGQKDIAESLGISVPAYCKLESGVNVINITRLTQLAELFEVSPDSLIMEGGIGTALHEENRDLKIKLKESSDYCIVLQRKLIAAYEILDELKAKGAEHGGVLNLLK
jgi:transcriptional regulator with XRE-family HTH domain